MRSLTTIAVVLALLAAAHKPLAQDIRTEQEPNDKEEQAQRVAPGAKISGSLESESDVDCFLLEVAQACTLDIELVPPDTQQLSLQIDSLLPRRADVYDEQPGLFLGIAAAPGRYLVRVACGQWDDEGEYSLEFRRTELPADFEAEPNDRDDEETPLRLGTLHQGQRSRADSDHDLWSVKLETAGIFKLELTRQDREAEELLSGDLLVESTDDLLYTYAFDEVAHDFVFYPVLQAGSYRLRLKLHEGAAGARYSLKLEPCRPAFTPGLEKLALAGIERGVRNLKQLPQDRAEQPHASVTEATAMMALLETGQLPAPELERDYLAFLEGYARELNEPGWNGRPLAVLEYDGLYQNAIAVLCLSEAALAGNQRARELCQAGVRFLLAAQQTERKPDEWGGPFDPEDEGHGGWRYGGDSRDSDLSVAGWCLVALLAADAAGIKVDGMREAVRLGTDYIKRCYSADLKGFTYQTGGGGGTGNIRNAVGLLLLTLLDPDMPDYPEALADIDHHLPAGTQVDDGENYPFYYWYYATRLNYLRGGKAWETWRSLMIEQLARRQLPDGSWQAIRHEHGQVGDRFTTGLGVLILRMCLNKAPAYLRPEARGF
ncbi:MAG: hypothetical protein M5U25_16125 [Planctomycetota bacterium]|nr:hypothetical protein [Planctomycetota bacterium]